MVFFGTNQELRKKPEKTGKPTINVSKRFLKANCVYYIIIRCFEIICSKFVDSFRYCILLEGKITNFPKKLFKICNLYKIIERINFI